MNGTRTLNVTIALMGVGWSVKEKGMKSDLTKYEKPPSQNMDTDFFYNVAVNIRGWHCVG